MLGKCSEAVDVDVVHCEEMQKELTRIFVEKLHV